MKQHTLLREYFFEGKGLHTGRYAHMSVGPAPVDTGIRFLREDIGEDAFVDALAENVSGTARSTTISRGRVTVKTIEHLLSALTGLGVDNALVRIDAPEVPILDGSAGPYAEAIAADGTVEQDAERRWIELKETVEITDKPSGAYIRISPWDEPVYESTIDFNSHVLGVQTVRFDSTTDYASQIAPCRTFCFAHELLKLSVLGLVKGGDVDNAIVVVEKPVSDWQRKRLCDLFHQPRMDDLKEGYLKKGELRFSDECGRHKILDLMGDLRLCGGFFKAKVEAFKPGHRVNTLTSKKIRKTIIENG